MNIGINATYLSQKNKTGIENYSSSAIYSLLENDKNNSYSLFSQLKLPDQAIKINSKIRIFYSPFMKGWHTFRLPLALLQHPVDIFFDPGYSTPPFVKIPTVSVVHDLAFKFFPDAYSKSQLSSLNNAFSKVSKNAAGIIFTSRNTQKDFFHYYPNFHGKTKVILQSYNQALFSKQNLSHKSQVNIPDKYILSIGRLEKRKNIIVLIRSYIEMRKNNPDIKEKLLLVGKAGIGYEEIKKEILASGNYKNDIIEIGYAQNNDLPSIYFHSSLFAFLSLYEGFGIPILEAFASNVPVLCSNTSSLPEVAGDAAIYTDPKNILEISKKMAEIITNNKIRDNIIQEGKKQLSKFNWGKFSSELLTFLTEVYESRNST